MPKPPGGLDIPKADEVEVGPYPQDIVQTPVTPVPAEGFMSLRYQISSKYHDYQAVKRDRS
jgi:hypothetical protein